MSPQMRKIWPVFLLAYMVVVTGCASFKPRSMEETAFQVRAQTQSEDKVRVTAAVLSSEETRAVFDVPLYKKGVQPIWLEIENQDDKPIWFLPFSVDPDYFSPLEVTYPFHRTFDKKYNDQIDRYFLDHAMGLFLAPGSSRSGFVFTNLDLGTKNFNVDLVGDDNLVKTFGFVKGVGAAAYEKPRGNLTGDPYFTDGYRAVLWVSGKPMPFSDVGWIDWEALPEK